MGSIARITMTNGEQWAVVSDFFTDAGVIIPVGSDIDMTDAEIGKEVRRLFLSARILSAEIMAEYFLGTDRLDWTDVDKYYDEFVELRNESDSINAAVLHIEFLRVKAKEKEEMQLLKRIPSKKLRESIIRRDGGRCRYCGSELSSVYIDHVNPFSLGGKTEYSNLVCSCFSCNSKKGARTPEDAGMVLLEFGDE